jgi:predicted Rossmann fold flavoprotein
MDSKNIYDLVVIGGGAAGIFASINAKTIKKEAKILILERSSSLLAKVKISGGSRCNVTNACYDLKELSKHYPRGEKELISAFYVFQPKDMILWLESRGVKLQIDDKKRVFPLSNNSLTIVDCFLDEAYKKGIEISINQEIVDISKENDVFEISLINSKKILCKKLLLATGSSEKGFELAEKLGHLIKKPIPSLFSFKIQNSKLFKDVCGISVFVKVKIKNTSFLQEGDLLFTHEGFSGPCIINLSSYAARYLYENKYRDSLIVNWTARPKDEIEQNLTYFKKIYPKKTLRNIKIFNFPKSLWTYLLRDSEIKERLLKDISNKDLKKIADELYCDTYKIEGRSINKQEFVTCGGIDLKEVDFKDMQSKICKNLYFAGEILDVDGVTGGYNLQNAWTTGYIAGLNI